MIPLQALNKSTNQSGFVADTEKDDTVLSVHDVMALRTAIELTSSDFCFDGDHYPLVLPLSNEELNQLSEEQLVQRMSRKAELWYSEIPF